LTLTNNLTLLKKHLDRTGLSTGIYGRFIEQKLRYITQIMTSKSVSRSCEDVDETVLTAAEIKAIATSNPLLAEKMSADNEVARLKLLKCNWTNEQLILDRSINIHYPETVARNEKRIEEITRDLAVLEQHRGGDFMIVVDGKAYDERAAAGEALLQSSGRNARSARANTLSTVIAVWTCTPNERILPTLICGSWAARDTPPPRAIPR
jgi:hypothetical protein